MPIIWYRQRDEQFTTRALGNPITLPENGNGTYIIMLRRWLIFQSSLENMTGCQGMVMFDHDTHIISVCTLLTNRISWMYEGFYPTPRETVKLQKIALFLQMSKLTWQWNMDGLNIWCFFHRKLSIVMLDCQRVARKSLSLKICQRAWRIKKGIQQEHNRVALAFHNNYFYFANNNFLQEFLCSLVSSLFFQSLGQKMI